jgi:thiamine-phosphate pyrophosphorylase
MKGLYLVTPDWDDTDALIKATETALSVSVGLLQYRHKTANGELRLEQASALLKLCRQHNVPFIINDHIDLCITLDADGIHVGGTDASVAVVRTLIGKDKILGASCYGDFALAEQAQIAGASYVAFGGFYPSRVKKYEVSTPASIVSKAKSQLTLPVCVIGGMTPENAKPLVKEGADMVAAISSVYSADDIAIAVQEFVALFKI